MARRRSSIQAFSLFSFQDIITSVTGVIILVMLLLSVELIQRKMVTLDTAPSVPNQLSRDKLSRLEEQIQVARALLKSGESFIAEIAKLPNSSLSQREAELGLTMKELSKDFEQLASAAAVVHASDEALSSKDLPRLQEELTAAQEANRQVREQLRSLANKHQVIYNPNPFSQKTAWLVDLSPRAIRVAEPGNTDHFLEFKDGAVGTAIQRFVSWANQRDKRSEYFVLLLRPMSIKQYTEIHRRLSEAGYDLGVDLLESNATVIDPLGEGS